MSDIPTPQVAEPTNAGREQIDKVIKEMFNTEKTFRDTLIHFLQNEERLKKNEAEDRKRKKGWSDQDKEALKKFTNNANGIVAGQNLMFEKVEENKSTILELMTEITNVLKGTFGYYEAIANDFNNLQRVNFDVPINDKSNVTSGSVYIAPIQRLPRWVILIKEILETDRKKGGLSDLEEQAFSKFLIEAETVAKH